MNIQRLIGLYCLAFLLAGCSNWLDVQPYDQISEDELVKSEEGFQKALNGIYIGLNDEALYGKSLTVEMIEIMGGAYEIGNESLVWGNYTDLKDYNYNTEYWRSCMSSTWDKAYALILNCNKLLENMKSREELFTGNNYNIIQGEALALRAMLHFDMLRLFGPVYSRNPEATSIPYYTSEVLSPRTFAARIGSDDKNHTRFAGSTHPPKRRSRENGRRIVKRECRRKFEFLMLPGTTVKLLCRNRPAGPCMPVRRTTGKCIQLFH